MKYSNIKHAVFLERPNRFIAYAMLNEEIVKCHVKNTGRCRELLIPGESHVYLVDHGPDAKRATRYSLIAVEKTVEELKTNRQAWKTWLKEGITQRNDGSYYRLINMDSQIPNTIAYEWLLSGGLGSDIAMVKREQKFHNSRFDIYYERKDGRKGFLEVKGVTLEQDGIARFPDAPTERGVKHIYELMDALKEGYEAGILFVIQMKGMLYLTPNDETHKEFGDALRRAEKAGVTITAIDCHVTQDELLPGDIVPVKI